MTTDPEPRHATGGQAATDVVGVLLAGGQARRMGGGDKCRQVVAGRSLLDQAIARAGPQVKRLVLNTNGEPGRFADTGLPVVLDAVDGFAGPLAGILTGMEWARRHVPGCRWVVSIATDTPFFPVDLVARFRAAVDAENADLAYATSGGRTHPVFGLWPLRLTGPLRAALVDEQVRKIDRWTARYRVAIVSFDTTPVDPFFNVNAPEDLVTATALATARTA